MPELICNRCQKEITDMGYIKVVPLIILNEVFDKNPLLFTCKEHAENYTISMTFHDDCWMDELKDHGVKTHDLEEIRKKKIQETLEKLKENNKES